jgi:hypothetical protein
MSYACTLTTAVGRLGCSNTHPAQALNQLAGHDRCWHACVLVDCKMTTGDLADVWHLHPHQVGLLMASRHSELNLDIVSAGPRTPCWYWPQLVIASRPFSYRMLRALNKHLCPRQLSILSSCYIFAAQCTLQLEKTTHPVTLATIGILLSWPCVHISSLT